MKLARVERRRGPWRERSLQENDFRLGTAGDEMVLLLPVILILAVPVAFGFVSSRRQRLIDWRHFAAFIGFSSGIVAIPATLLWAAATLRSRPTIARQEFAFIVGTVGIVASLAAFVAGLVSRGIRRFQLVAFAVVIGFVYLLGMFTHFGD